MTTIADAVQIMDVKGLPPDDARSWRMLAVDIVLFFAVAALLVAVDDWLLGLPVSLGLGVVVYRLFVLKHDCGHRAFSRTVRGNDIAGHIAGAFAFFPFHAWRVVHDQHHRYTHLVGKDGALEPMTPEDYRRAPAAQRLVYRVSRKYWPGVAATGFVIAMLVLSVSGHLLKLYPDANRRQIRLSAIVAWSALIAGVAAAWSLAGWYGIVYLVMVPQLVCHQLFAVTSLVQHTAPDSCLRTTSSWTPMKARLEHTFHFALPRFVHWLSHHIFWHVPHHISPAIPHYHLETAHRRLAAALPDDVRVLRLSLRGILEVQRRCQLIEVGPDGSTRWLSFADADAQSAAVPACAVAR